MGGYLRLFLPFVLLGCVDLTRPPELVERSVADAAAAPPTTPSEDDGAAGGATVPTALDAPTSGDDTSSVGSVPAFDAGSQPEDAPPPPPVLTGTGRPCGGGPECQSGFCVDGFCCESACAGTCRACDVAGSEGSCVPVPAGEDPAGECQRGPVRGCGLDGTCDGSGACRKYPVGTECAPGACVGANEIAAATCNAAGMCQPGASRSCAPNVCNGDSCSSRCSDQSPCLNGFFCDVDTCRRRKETGADCANRAECSSGHCEDGVCCATECAQGCFSCKLPGSVGTCTAVPDGAVDPKGQCLPEAGQPCGRLGGCNGKGACRVTPAGTACGAPRSCTGSAETGASVCNGVGGCDQGAARDCGPYLCNGAACGTTCSGDAQCKSGFFCARGACGPAKIASLVVHDSGNAGGWSAQRNLQTGASGGARPWTDYPDSYVARLDTALAPLVGREWLRVVSASKNFSGAPQATITLSTTSDVYLVVDDRWSDKSFTAGWTDTGANLHVFESNSRPDLSFSVYKKPAQTGPVTLPPIGNNMDYDNFIIVD
jgi:hypothetical protein